MPYIKPIARPCIDELIKKYKYDLAANGPLNYFLVKLMLTRRHQEGESYAFYKSFLGELEMAKMEIYRKYVVPYENKKEIENGPVKE